MFKAIQLQLYGGWFVYQFLPDGSTKRVAGPYVDRQAAHQLAQRRNKKATTTSFSNLLKTGQIDT